MEASGAGPAAGNGDGGGEAAADNGLGQVSETLAALQSGQEELRSFLQSEPWQQQPAPAAEPQAQEPDALDLSFLDDPDLPPDDLADRLTDAFDQRSQSQLQAALAPLQEKISEQERAREAEALVSEFPDLGDAETAEAVVQASRQWAEMAGQPELANSPTLWRLVYMAGRAADAANSESPEGSAAHLEGSGGAGPAGGQQVDMADRIINAGGPQRVLPF